MRTEKPPSDSNSQARPPSSTLNVAAEIKADRRLMKIYGKSNVKRYPHCGVLAHVVANFCSVCGGAFAA